jgi:hypothetical protein
VPRICDPDVTKNYDTVELATDHGAAAPDPKKEWDWMRPSELIKENKFIYFIAQHVLTMLILSYAFMNLIRMAPRIASQMAGSRGSAPLGAGFGRPAGGLFNTASRFSEWARDNIVKKDEKPNKAEGITQTTAGAAAVGGGPVAAAGMSIRGVGTAVDPDNKPYTGNTGKRK